MEHLFSPCTRLHDILDSEGRLEEVLEQSPGPLQELNLNVSAQELLGAERAFTYADLYALLGNATTVAWLTPYAAIAREDGLAMYAWEQLHRSYRFCFTVDGIDISALARSPEHLVEICDVVVRLLAVSEVHSVVLDNWCSSINVFINAPTLAYLMEQCQSLKVLPLVNQEMDEDHCRVLGDFSRPDLEIVLHSCRITDAGASALAEVLGRNQGPTKLVCCITDNVVLTNGLRGNSRLTTFKAYLSGGDEDRNRQVLAIVGALRENKGLVELNLTCYGFKINDDAWGAICDSFKAHPTLEVLNLRATLLDDTATPAVLKSRIQALVDMLKVNTLIHTILLHNQYSLHELFRESVIPYLERNRFRPHLRAIQKTRPIAYRAKVLGRALLSARTDPNRFWMVLSGNAEVAFPSTTTSSAAAANLSDTPTTAAATSTTNVAAVATSVMSALTTTATGSLPTAASATTNATSAATPSTASASDACASSVAVATAANVAIPFAGQKRKARP